MGLVNVRKIRFIVIGAIHFWSKMILGYTNSFVPRRLVATLTQPE
jgi:hypothetical protein